MLSWNSRDVTRVCLHRNPKVTATQLSPFPLITHEFPKIIFKQYTIATHHASSIYTIKRKANLNRRLLLNTTNITTQNNIIQQHLQKCFPSKTTHFSATIFPSRFIIQSAKQNGNKTIIQRITSTIQLLFS